MVVERFASIFRDEHRRVRDGLVALIEAFERGDRARARSLLGEIAVLTGPHFRYEEEALYPALVGIFTPDHVEALLGAHDRAISAAKELVALAHQERLTDAERSKAVRLIRSILPHVSDCDGLSIMVETLPDPVVERILETRERALRANLDLLEWAEKARSLESREYPHHS